MNAESVQHQVLLHPPPFIFPGLPVFACYIRFLNLLHMHKIIIFERHCSLQLIFLIWELLYSSFIIFLPFSFLNIPLSSLHFFLNIVKFYYTFCVINVWVYVCAVLPPFNFDLLNLINVKRFSSKKQVKIKAADCIACMSQLKDMVRKNKRIVPQLEYGLCNVFLFSNTLDSD